MNDTLSLMDSKGKILIVEDDEFLREVYSETLTEAGYAVDVAVDGQEGYEKIRAGGWDLVLLDIIMPKMSGLDIMRKLQSETIANPNKHVVFLTNLDKDEEIKEALKLGEGYIIKSEITPGDLLKEILLYLH